MSEKAGSCAEPAAGPIIDTAEPEAHDNTPENKEILMQAKVGQKAPDFEATAFIDGEFKNIKLSDYAGSWTTLCFYPGDFTFV